MYQNEFGDIISEPGDSLIEETTQEAAEAFRRLVDDEEAIRMYNDIWLGIHLPL